MKIHLDETRASCSPSQSKCCQKPRAASAKCRVFSVFFRLPSVRSQRMFYQFAHNKCLDYSQAEQRAEARVFPVVVRLPSRKRMFHQFSQRQLSILKTSFYLIQIFLLLHQLTPQSQGQSSCQICCDYYTGDYGKASKQCNEVFKMWIKWGCWILVIHIFRPHQS